MELPCQILPATFEIRDCVNHESENLSSTIVYDNIPKINPIKITESLYIGPIQHLNSVNPSYVLNLTSTNINSPNYHVFDCPIKSSNFHQFVKYIPECIKFIENYKKLDKGKVSYICCRNGYSRSLVVLAAYKLMSQGENIHNVIQQLKSTSLYVSPQYISFLYLLNKLRHY